MQNPAHCRKWLDLAAAYMVTASRWRLETAQSRLRRDRGRAGNLARVLELKLSDCSEDWASEGTDCLCLTELKNYCLSMKTECFGAHSCCLSAFSRVPERKEREYWLTES